MSRAASPRPCRVIRPRTRAPLVITCEHAARALPSGLRPGPAERAILASHWGWDIGAWEVALRVARGLGAGAVGGRWSRLLVDLNRPVSDPTLVRRAAAGVALSWNARLAPAEVERRLLRVHAPYHEAIDRLIVGRMVRSVRPLLLAVHSFTPELDGRRRDFDVGLLFDRCRDEAVRLARSLRAEGLRVRYNQPYSGLAGMMYAIHRHGTHHGLPCLELEMNQRLLGGRRGIARMAAAVTRAMGSLIAV